ncbi:hypothetical protein Ocin01_11125, partial [Orchesella cincta]
YFFGSLRENLGDHNI